MARAAYESGDARQAVAYQRQALTEVSQKLGDTDKRTLECQAHLSAYTSEAVRAVRFCPVIIIII
jgi:hypothetical protein